MWLDWVWRVFCEFVDDKAIQWPITTWFLHWVYRSCYRSNVLAEFPLKQIKSSIEIRLWFQVLVNQIPLKHVLLVYAITILGNTWWENLACLVLSLSLSLNDDHLRKGDEYLFGSSRKAATLKMKKFDLTNVLKQNRKISRCCRDICTYNSKYSISV